MSETTISFGKNCYFTGRNGTFDQSGLQLTSLVYKGSGTEILRLRPITGKGKVANCSIEVPFDSLDELIDVLMEERNRLTTTKG